MTPTPLQKRLGLAQKLWTDEELIEEFKAYNELQAQQYDAKWEWEIGGWRMFPNQIGGFLMVIGFDANPTVRSSDAYEVDPKPRPWKICYKSSWDSKIVGLIGSYEKNSFETLEQARYQFSETAMRIEREFKDAGVTESTPRQAICGSCLKLHDWDNEAVKYFGMWTLTPYRQYDDTYDGCRGWD
jgi:hypothetical protein